MGYWSVADNLPFAGIWGGAELLLGINLLTGVPIERVELWIKVLLPSFALILVLYLMSATSSSTTGLTSVKRIVSGDFAIQFYLDVVIIGLVFPVTWWYTVSLLVLFWLHHLFSWPLFSVAS
jgi:hypothetical protein